MKQEQVIKSILIDLQKRQVICDGCDGIVAEYIGQAFAAGFEHGRYTVGQRRSVLQFDKAGELVCEYPSASRAAMAHGVNQSSISKAATGTIPSAAGFYWRYDR